MIFRGSLLGERLATVKPAEQLTYLYGVQGLQNTSNQTFRDIVGNGVQLAVPPFQRDYAWKREQWSDLWEDIEVATHEDEWHYMGFVVLQRRGDNNFLVIDGQQRLTTLSLLVLAAIATIEQKGGPDAEQRAEIIRRSYIGSQNAVTLTTTNKLTLNRHNDRLYRSYLSELRPPPTTGLKSSERLLIDASAFFRDKLLAIETGEQVAELIESVTSRFFFTVIQVTDELNAYRVFETLNARGVQLSAADLLKNYLFATVDSADAHTTELAQLEVRWSNIFSSLGRDSFQNFLRAYWNSRFEQVRAPQLYRAVRTEIKGAGEVFSLLRDLDDAAPIYAALRDPGHELWDNNPGSRKRLEVLKLLRVRQHLPLLLAGYQALEVSRFERLLADVVAFSFRYNTIANRNSGDQEILYGKIARHIRSDGTYSSDMLEPLFPEDQVFKSLLKNYTVSSSSQGKKLARYILQSLERQASNSTEPYSKGAISLEHVLPQQPSELLASGIQQHMGESSLEIGQPYASRNSS